MMRILSESRAMQNAADAVDGAVAELHGLNRTDLICLDVLDRHGTVSAGRLAEETRLTTGAMTRLLDRLEASGHIRRVADSGDRRRVLVESTERARQIGREAYLPIVEAWMGLRDRFTREQLEGILVFLEIGRELNLRRAAEIREQTPNRS